MTRLLWTFLTLALLPAFCSGGEEPKVMPKNSFTPKQVSLKDTTMEPVTDDTMTEEGETPIEVTNIEDTKQKTQTAFSSGKPHSPEEQIYEEAAAAIAEANEMLEGDMADLLGLPKQEQELPAGVAAPKALKVLQGSNFADVIGQGHTFVKFYAPWCGHCQDMAQDFEQLAEFFQENPIQGASLTIAEVDCTAGMDGSMGVCMQEGVDGYPTVKHFKDGDLVNDYHFARSFDRMKSYLRDKLFELSTLEPNAIGVFELNDLSFQKMIDSSGKTPIIVMFHVQWCQHCKELKDVWEELAIEFLMEESEDVKFAQVDCMEALDTCTEEDIESFPQIYLYKDGHMEDIFNGQRNLEEISNFVWQEVDPSRVVEDDPFDAILMGMNMKMGGGQEEEEEEEEEWEDCDCADPECDCSEDEEGEEYEDEEDEEAEGADDESYGEEDEGEGEEDEEDEDLTDEEIAHLEKGIQKDIEKRKQIKSEKLNIPKAAETKAPEKDNQQEEVQADKAHTEL